MSRIQEIKALKRFSLETVRKFNEESKEGQLSPRAQVKVARSMANDLYQVVGTSHSKRGTYSGPLVDSQTQGFLQQHFNKAWIENPKLKLKDVKIA